MSSIASIKLCSNRLIGFLQYRQAVYLTQVNQLKWIDQYDSTGAVCYLNTAMRRHRS